jgi:ABC-2 type transport system permease protein
VRSLVEIRWPAVRGLLFANLRTYARNPVPVFGVFGVLILLLVLVQFISTKQASPTDAVVADGAHTQLSAELVTRVGQLRGFHVRTASAAEATAAVRQRRADLGLIIPAGFGDTTAGTLARSTVRLVLRASSQSTAPDQVAAAVDALDREAQSAPPRLRTAVEFAGNAPTLADTFLPGLLGFNVINAALILAASTFAGYRTSGVLRRVQATGTHPVNLVVGLAAANAVLAAVQALGLLVAALIVFGGGVDIAPLWAITMAGYLAFFGIGFVISGLVRDAQRATGIASAVAMIMIFGGLFPPSTFSGPVAIVIGYLPIGLVTDGLRQVVEGTPTTVGRDLALLGLEAVVVLLLAAMTFRWDSD